MSWRTMLDEGRALARLRSGSGRLPRSNDAVSRHEPVLHHLGLAAHGDESAPVPNRPDAPGPNGWGPAPEPYRWTSPPPPPPRWSGRRPGLSGDDGQRPRRGPGRGTTLGWLATLCAAATLAFLVALFSSGGGSVRTSTSRQTVPASPSRAPSRSGMPPTAGPAGGAVSSPATAAPATSPPRIAPAAAPATAPAPAPAPATAAPAPARGSAAPPPAVPAPSTPPAPAGGGPVIASISPASGPSGTAVSLTGSGFFSASGSIVVLFGQVQAPVSCPTQQTCTATAPPQASPAPGPGAPVGPSAVPVTVTTDGGRSAPVVFTYTG